MHPDPMSGTLLLRPAQAASLAVRRFLGWWIGELAGLAPHWLLHLVAATDGSANVLEYARDHAVLVSAARGRAGPMRLPLDGMAAAELRARVRSALGRHRRGNRVSVRLDSSLVFEARLALPFSAQGALRGIVQHQIERLTPIDAWETCFDCRAAPRTPGARSLDVQVVVARRTTREGALALARDLGLRPRRVLAPEADRLPLVLWAATRTAGTGRGRTLRRVMETTAAALFLAAYALHIHRLDAIREDLRRRVAHAQLAADAARNVGREIVQTRQALAFLDRRRDSVPPLLALDELTRLVPLDAWVTRFSLRGQQAEIAGYAPRATDLIARIERSRQFAQPQFRSPITLSPDGRAEHFDISFDLRAAAGR
jgi:general secretion pathway protein L